MARYPQCFFLHDVLIHPNSMYLSVLISISTIAHHDIKQSNSFTKTKRLLIISMQESLCFQNAGSMHSALGKDEYFYFSKQTIFYENMTLNNSLKSPGPFFQLLLLHYNHQSKPVGFNSTLSSPVIIPLPSVGTLDRDLSCRLHQMCQASFFLRYM